MLTSLERLIGMPAVWQNRHMGLVERAVPDATQGRLAGLIVRRGIGGARWAENADILLLGENCIVLSQKPGRLPQTLPASFGKVCHPNGESAGMVTDVLVESAQRRILALEISPGPLYRLVGLCAYAPEYHASPGQVTVSALLPWTQLMSQLGEEENE